MTAPAVYHAIDPCLSVRHESYV